MKPIKYKPLIISLGALSPHALYYLTNFFAETTHFRFGYELNDPSDLKHTLAWGIITWYWLKGLEQAKPPRFKNFAIATSSALQGQFTNPTKNPERWLKINQRLNNATYRKPQDNEVQFCKYYAAIGDLEKSIFHLQKALDLYDSTQNNRYMALMEKLSRPLIALQFKEPTLDNLIEKATFELSQRNFEAFESIFQRALEKYPTEETNLIYAMFLTAAKQPKANELWHQIIEEHKHELQKIGESRNAVREIPGFHKSILIIKSSDNDLEQEYKILRQIYDLAPPEDRIAVMPLAFFKKDNFQYLITLRRDSPNIDSILQKSTEEERILLAGKALTQLQKFHSLNIEGLKPYDPLETLHRRLIQRVPQSNPTRFLTAYETFLRKFPPVNRPVHGDAYPTNFLADGRIIDLEKGSLGNPWLDYETLTTHPLLFPFQERLVSHLDQTSRELPAISIPLCQTGSFLNKDPKTSLYFYQLALDRLQALGERELYTATKDFIEPVIASLSSAHH